MKQILFLSALTTLLTTTGCLVDEGRGREHARYHGHSEVIVAAPVVVVPAPVVIVPVVRVR